MHISLVSDCVLSEVARGVFGIGGVLLATAFAFFAFRVLMSNLPGFNSRIDRFFFNNCTLHDTGAYQEEEEEDDEEGEDEEDDDEEDDEDDNEHKQNHAAPDQYIKMMIDILALPDERQSKTSEFGCIDNLCALLISSNVSGYRRCLVNWTSQERATANIMMNTISISNKIKNDVSDIDAEFVSASGYAMYMILGRERYCEIIDRLERDVVYVSSMVFYRNIVQILVEQLETGSSVISMFLPQGDIRNSIILYVNRLLVNITKITGTDGIDGIQISTITREQANQKIAFICSKYITGDYAKCCEYCISLPVLLLISREGSDYFRNISASDSETDNESDNEPNSDSENILADLCGGPDDSRHAQNGDDVLIESVESPRSDEYSE